MLLGAQCYDEDGAPEDVKEKAGSGCARGVAVVGMSAGDLETMYFNGGFDGMSLVTLLQAYAPASERGWLGSSSPRTVREAQFAKQRRSGDVVFNPEISYAKRGGGGQRMVDDQLLPSMYCWDGLAAVAASA